MTPGTIILAKEVQAEILKLATQVGYNRAWEIVMERLSLKVKK